MTVHRFRVTVDGMCTTSAEGVELMRHLHGQFNDFLDGKEEGKFDLTDVEVTTDVKPAVSKGVTAEWWTDTALGKARETLKTAFPGLLAVRNITATTDLERAQHLLWMCDEIKALLNVGEREKAMRWLGFVQGSFWPMGLRTITAMMQDNTPV